jgi:hypothetical protein
MRLKLYNNSLLVPLKCGTRYLDTIFCDESISYDTRGFKHHLFISNVSDIVVRPPMEHLTSALHTAILTFHNHPQTNNDAAGDITNIIDEFCLYDKKTDVQNTHWRGDLYETLYWLWRRNRNNINIIELKDLSLYLQKLNIKKLPKFSQEVFKDFHEPEFSLHQLPSNVLNHLKLKKLHQVCMKYAEYVVLLLHEFAACLYLF